MDFTPLGGAQAVPSRVVGANIAFEWLIYIIGIAAISIAVWFSYRRLASWGATGRIKEMGAKGLARNAWEAMTQKRMVRSFGPVALFHIFIVVGFVVLLLNSAIDAVSHITGWFAVEGPLYYITSLSADISGVVLTVGLIGLFVIKYVIRPKRQAPVSWKSGAVLIAFAFAVASGYLVEGARIAAQMLQTADLSELSYEQVASPVGWLVALGLRSLGLEAVLVIHRYIWWIHALFIMVGIALLPFGKMWHVVAAIINGAGRTPATPAPIDDYEDESKLGVEKAANLTWDDTADLYACIECGACNDACPAVQAGYPLSPKQSLILSLRNERDSNMAGSDPIDLSKIVGDQALWSCTTCRACVEACPLHIDHVGKVIDIRRRVSLWDEEAPDDLQAMFINLDMNQNPWGLGYASRADWVKDLNLEDVLINLAENPDAEFDYLLFAGCFAAYDLAYRREAAACIRLLASYGVRLGYLGIEEACCGDPARRLGNEFLFESLADQNRDAFERYQVKRIVTLCPHCLNTLANEYPDKEDYPMPPIFSIDDLLMEFKKNNVVSSLVSTEEDQSALSAKKDMPVLAQEPCYLVRYNTGHPSTTDVLEGAGVHVVNPNDYWGPTCCGGGGGCMWMDDRDIEKVKRISETRLEVLESKAASAGLDPEETRLITNCPYCFSMFNDAVSETESKTRVVGMGTYLLDRVAGKD